MICTQVQHWEVQSLQPDQVLTKRSTLWTWVQDTRSHNYGRDCYGLQESIPRYENKESDHRLAIWSNWLDMIPNFLRIDNQTYFADIQIGMNKVLIRYTYNISSEWEDLQQACNRMVRLLQDKGILPKPKRKRTLAQNALYRAWLDIVAKESGNNSNLLHANMKRLYLSKRKRLVIKKKISYVYDMGSTTDLNVEQFTEFLNKVYTFFSDFGYVLPTEDKLDMDSLINTYWKY